MPDEIEFHRVAGDGDWTAVYLNGKLQRVGDSYLADEWLQSHVGVTVVEDSPCMLDEHRAMKTLAEVQREVAEREQRAEEARKLREQAAELERQASLLES